MAPSRAFLQRAARSAQPVTTLCRAGRIEPRPFGEPARYAHIKGSPPPRAVPTSTSKRAPEESEQQVLEKPDRYRKPSHPARLPRRSSLVGPPLSEEELQAQKTKQYPNMMPPEGTKLHWFLTNRRIHLVITFGILGSLCGFVWIDNFRSSLSPQEHDLLPRWNLLPLHPFEFFGRFIEVYRLHVARTSLEVENMRLQNVADARKREMYRKAHGIEIESIPNLLGFKEKKPDAAAQQDAEISLAGSGQTADAAAVAAGPTQDVESYQDFEGRKQRQRKWAPFGISLW